MKTQLRAAQVVEACKAYMMRRASRIAREREELLQRAMSKDQRGLWARLVRHDPIYLNRTEAQQHLENNNGMWGSEWDWPEQRGIRKAEKVSQLLILAEVVGGSTFVELTDEEAFIFERQ